MSPAIQIIPWFIDSCSLYAVKRGEVCLPEDFLAALLEINESHAHRLSRFMVHVLHQDYISPMLLRNERPELGIFAMYNHKHHIEGPYNPSRVLCRFVGGSNRILLLGAGFVKSKDEPIQSNLIANSEAVFLAELGTMLDARIDCGEIVISGSQLVAASAESFTF